MDKLAQLARIVPSERILLLPHCLRHSNTCQATYNQEGLQCQGCTPDCAINRLCAAASECGYKGVCVAPGGRLAINFIKEKRPRAIVAIACEKELEEGIDGINKLAVKAFKPVVVIIRLIKDGCLDTVVDQEKALEIVRTGCILEAVGK